MLIVPFRTIQKYAIYSETLGNSNNDSHSSHGDWMRFHYINQTFLVEIWSTTSPCDLNMS